MADLFHQLYGIAGTYYDSADASEGEWRGVYGDDKVFSGDNRISSLLGRTHVVFECKNQVGRRLEPVPSAKRRQASAYFVRASALLVAAGDIRFVSERVYPDVKGWPSTVRSKVSEVVARLATANWNDVGAISHDLEAAVGASVERDWLADWLASEEASRWVVEGRVGLCAVLEVGAFVRLPGLAKLCVEAIEVCEKRPDDGAAMKIGAVAAQRLRLLWGVDDALRDRAFTSLSQLLPKWISAKEWRRYGLSAMSSLPFTGGRSCVAMLEGYILEGDPDVALAATTSALEWGSGTFAGPAVGGDDVAQKMAAALRRRLKRQQAALPADRTLESAELVARIIGALGLFTPVEGLEDFAAELASAFREPHHIEDSAAVRSARVLFQRFPEVAPAKVGEALGGWDTPVGLRFISLLATLR